MADDINSYALNLAFQLQTAPAVASLGDILSSINNIQDGIQRVANILAAPVTKSLTFVQEQFTKIAASSVDLSAATTKIDGDLASMQTQFDRIARTNEAMSKTTTKLETDLTAIQKHYGEIDKLTTKTSKVSLKSFLDFDKIRKWLPQVLKDNKLISAETIAQAKHQADIMDSIQDISKAPIDTQAGAYAGTSQHIASIWESINKTDSDIAGRGKQHITAGSQIAAAWSTILGLGNKANKQNEECAESSGKVAASWVNVTGGVKSTIVNFAEMIVGIEAAKMSFAGFVDEEVKFSTANYRLYGQQREIIAQVNATTNAYGLMRKQVLEAYVGIAASVRTNKEELDKMVRTNVEFSTILGVNQKDLGAWQRSMTGIGVGVKESRAILSHYTSVMREMGMTAQQLSKILGDQTKNAAMMSFTYGVEGTKQLNNFTVAIGGLGNALNINEEDVNSITTNMQKSFVDYAMQLEAYSSLSAEALSTIPPELQEAAKAQSGLSNIMAQAGAIVGDVNLETGENAKYAAKSLNALGQQFGYTGTDMVNMLRIQRSSAKDLGDVWTSANDKIAKSVKATGDATRAGLKGEALIAYDFNQATNSLAQHFKIAMSSIETAWSKLMIVLAPAIDLLIKAFGVLAWTLDKIADIISLDFVSFLGLGKAVDDTTGSVWSSIFSWQGLWDILKGVAVVAGGLAVTWWILIPAIGAAISYVAALIPTLGFLIPILGSLATLWQGLMAMISVPKMWAIAVAAVAIGAAFLMVAIAFEKVAALGWAVIAPLAATVVVLGMLTLVLPPLTAALLAVGTIGWVGVAALLALGAAALMTAGAMYIISLAFKNVASGLAELYDVSGGAWGLLGFGLALVAFGIELAAAAITIGIGATAMAVAAVPLGVAMGLLSVAMYLISGSAIETIGLLGDGRLDRFGAALQSSAIGIAAFLIEMGTGTEFSYAMGNLSSGINKIDPERTITASESLLTLGRALEAVSKFSFDNLSGMAGSITAFADSITDAFDALKSSVDRAVLGIVSGLFGVTLVMWQLQGQMTYAFLDLLLVIPIIAAVTDRIADAIEAGQSKIKGQVDALKTSFTILEMLSSKLGVSATTEEPDKKKVMAETISTVQVKTETAGSVANRWKQEEMQQRQIDIMDTIATAVQKISGGNIDDVGAIKTLLQTYLPKMGESPSKLSTRLNSWQ